MVRNRSSRRPKLPLEPKPEPEPGSRPVTATQENPRSPKSHASGSTRSWSKCDVVFVMNGIVDFIAKKGLDPFNNLDCFVEFINDNSLFDNGNVLKKITWKLRESGSSNNCVLHLEGSKNGVSKSSDVGKGSVVVGGEEKSILGNNGGEISCYSVPNRLKKSTFGGNESILGKCNGGVSCSSMETVAGIDCVKTLENMEKNSSVGGEKSKSKSRSRGRGKGRGRRKSTKIMLVGEESIREHNVGDEMKKIGGEKSKSRWRGRLRRKTTMLVGGESIREASEGDVMKIIGGENPIPEAVKGGMKNKNGVVLTNFGFEEKKDVMLVNKGSVRLDYGEEICTKTQNNLKDKSGGAGVKRSKSRGGIRSRGRRTAIHVGRKAVPKVRDYGGMRQNSKSNTCGENPNIESKKNFMKNNNLGFWNENEVMMREALRRMISNSVSVREELQADLPWCPPKIGVLKWNTDASLREDNKTAAIGGVLRDWHGSFRCVFSCPVDCFDSNEVEVRAIYKALELASCKDWLLSLNMVIESDSLNAVTWCNEDNGGPLNLGYMLSFIRECRRWWPGLEITHMGRKSNSVADRLAKQGHQRSVDFIAWM